MQNKQTKFLFFIILSFIICFIKSKTIVPTSNWTLDIKSENDTNDIVLRPNILTRITLIVKHEDGKFILDRSFDDSQFIITLEDTNIVFYPNELKIIPSESLEYSAYIGLKCEFEIGSNTYDLNFKLKNTKNLEGKDIHDSTLTINPVTVKINRIQSLIELEPVETDLAEKAYSFLRLKKEIYNMEDIVIINNDDKDENFKFKEITIKAFKDREEFGEYENENHGILFDFPFGTESEYEDLNGKANHTYNLLMKNDKCSNWFKISEESETFDITINPDPLVVLNDSIKEAIIYTMENITPKKDLSNNIQLKMVFPVAPIIIECNLKGDSNNGDDHDVKYRDYIVKTGPYILRVEDLYSDNEYKAECKLFSLYSDKTEIQLKIGNEKDYDFITPLIPSRMMNNIPQCLEFIFSSKDNEKLEDKVKKFSDLSEKLCHKVMTEDQNILSRIMGSYKCKKTELSEEVEKNKKNRAILCIGASPSFKSKKFRETLFNNDTYYEDHVNKYIKLIDSTEKIKQVFSDEDDINDLELVSLKRYYDLNSPDVNKIKLVVDNSRNEKKELSFKITSTNEQPIECFYNEEIKNDDIKRFINLNYNNVNGKGITLYPNEEKVFQTKFNDLKEKKMYSLYMNCYNLPGSKIRYEQTGIFNAYTYLYTQNEDDQNIISRTEVTINCAEKNNRINPNCLKGKYNSLLNKIKTKMPEVDINEEMEKFNKLSNKAQLELLEDLTDNFNKDIKNMQKKTTKFINKLINMERYLSNRDCSIYSSGTSNDLDKTINNEQYKKCRDTKKKIQKELIKLIKDLSLKELIDGLSTNIEENMKYIILLIQEFSNNYDSFSEGEGNILYNLAINLQENFDEYWSKVEQYLKDKGSLEISISAVKKDIANLLIQTLNNLVKVLHFEEIDNYIPTEKRNITKAGIMAHEKGKKLYKSLKEFLKHFNEFGNGEYNLTDSLLINVTINEDYKENETRNLLEDNNDKDEIDEQTIKYEDKGIVVILHPKYMLKSKNAYAMQTVSFDSPIMPIKTSGDNDDCTLDTFVTITLYDNKGNEVSIDDLPENVRPKILYNRSYHKYLKHCFFYNEKTQDLDEYGLSSNDNVKYNGKNHFQCTTKHLTSFTAGNYYEPNSGIGAFAWVMIILGCILLLLAIIVLILFLRRRRKKNSIETEIKAEKDNDMKLMD